MWAPNIWFGVSVESERFLHRVDTLRDTSAAVRFLSLEPLLGPLPTLDLRYIDWVIVGGESGPGARPMSVNWVVDIRDQCARADVPFFFKQWGAFGVDGRRRSKKDNGRLLDGQTWDGWPEHAEKGVCLL